MPNRPAIPVETERQIYIEAGHRCAICGTPFPTERAHIIPWCNSQDHKPDNLICLCANCHERADQGEWGEKVLREYKQRPWIMRQFGMLDGMPQATVRLQITIQTELDNLSETEERWLLHGLASFLGISPYCIAIVKKEPANSVRVSIILPEEAASSLLRAFRESDPRLADFLGPMTISQINESGSSQHQSSVTPERDARSRASKSSGRGPIRSSLAGGHQNRRAAAAAGPAAKESFPRLHAFLATLPYSARPDGMESSLERYRRS
jgi:type I restriction enzyme, R subunit